VPRDTKGVAVLAQSDKPGKGKESTRSSWLPHFSPRSSPSSLTASAVPYTLYPLPSTLNPLTFDL